MKQDEKRGLVNGTWLLQILAISASGLSMAAIGILLAHYNSEPIFDWNGITLNAIIAVLSTISKVTLAFTLSECLGQAKWIWFSKERPLSDIDLLDSGSRGPLGSFKILTQPIALSYLSMGAIIIVLSVAIDPFVQLTVGKRDALKYEKSLKVQIAYAQRYDKGSLDGWDNAVYLGELSELEDVLTLVDADLGMKSAVSYGLSQPDSLISQQIQHSCPSGNCSWDNFTSLAVCSRCNDLTNQIEEVPPENPMHDSESNRVRQLPNGLQTYYAYPMYAYGSGNENNSVSFTSYDTLIWSMAMINATLKDPETKAAEYSAIECGLWYCVNNYTSAVKDGILTEIIEPAPSARDPDSWRPFVYNGDIREDINSDGLSKSINVYDTSIVIRPDEGEGHSSPILLKRTVLQLGEGFNLSQAAIYSISKLMNNTFVDLKAMADGYGNAVVSHGPPGGGDSEHGGRTYHPTVMQSLYHSQDLEKIFASLARSMTNHIRQNDVNNSVVYGREGKVVALFRIQGRFLILPVILIFGGAVFLAVTSYYTHKFKIPFWGTHALPIVALGGKMGPNIFDDKDIKTTSTMEQKAKQLFVQFPTFQPGGGGGGEFDRVDAIDRIENQEMVPSSRSLVVQNPEADAVSVVSSLRSSLVARRSSTDALSMVSIDYDDR